MKTKIRLDINGFSRIGRMTLRAAMIRDDVEVVAINDLLPIDHLGPSDRAPEQGDEADTVLIRSGSCIVVPLGNVPVEPDSIGERIRVAEIDRRRIVRSKHDLVVGHYARRDVFHLSVGNGPKPATSFENSSHRSFGTNALDRMQSQEGSPCSA